VHEIKHDGYRLIARRIEDRVKLYTRRGYNWADRYPRIVDALHSLRVRSVMIDGEAVVCSSDGRSDFDRLHSGGYDADVLLYSFDLIELNGDDLRPIPLDRRKGELEKLVAAATAYAFPSISTATAQPFSRMLASSGLRGLSPSGETFLTAPADARHG